MFIETGRVVRYRWIPAGTVAALLGTATLAGAVPAEAIPIKLVNCNADPGALQPAINGAAQGQTLLVTGTCTGAFTISASLTLTGLGQAVLDGNQAGRTVTVGVGAKVHLDHLTITKGVGGINNQGTLTVNDSAVRGNTASNGPGGGINNEVNATLVVTGSTLRDNYSLGAGGGINNNGSMAVFDSHLSGNSADNCGGIDSVGIGVTATVNRSSVHDNVARVADGGGICDGQGKLTLFHSVVFGNSAAFGAGVYNNGGSASVIGSAVIRNTASNQGGGIYNVDNGTMTVTRSAVAGNTASGGPGSGGGVYQASGNVNLIESVVRDNTPDNCAPPGSVPGCTG